MRPGQSRFAGLPFYGPAAAYFALFLLAPLLTVVAISFTEWSGFTLGSAKWVGLDNFGRMAKDPIFWASLWHTVLFVAVTTVALNVLGFGIALLIHTRLRGHDLLRIAILLPLAVSPVVASMVWQQMVGPLGLLNQGISALGRTPIAFLGPELAFATLLVVSVWMFTGYDALLYYAGLQTLPSDRLDAASVDGAGTWARIRHVIVPYMRPVIAVVVVLNLIGGWKVFDVVFVLTRGGPSRMTEMLSTYLYQQAFAQSKVGYASAIAVVIVVFATASAILRGRIHGETEA
jgi:multiple sugar transport system permease protein